MKNKGCLLQNYLQINKKKKWIYLEKDFTNTNYFRMHILFTSIYYLYCLLIHFYKPEY